MNPCKTTYFYMHVPVYVCIDLIFIILLGCRNDNTFVKVEYVRHTQGANVSCIFQDHQDTSQKSCSIKYGPCGGKLSCTVETTSVDDSSSSIILLTLNPQDQYVGETFCYTITASNTTYAVIVEGQIGERLILFSSLIAVCVHVCIILWTNNSNFYTHILGIILKCHQAKFDVDLTICNKLFKLPPKCTPVKR